MKEEENIFEINKPFFYPGGDIGVVLVHGFTGGPFDLKPLGEFLAKKGFTVSGVRLQGHGVHYQALKLTNRFDWYYSLKRAIDEIRPKVKKIFIIGFSMGGNLALLFTKLEKGIDGLVLINTPVYTKPGRLVFWFIPLIKNFKKFTTKKWAADIKDYFEKGNQGTYNRVPLDSAWQYYKLVQDAKEILSEINLPVQIFQSKNDSVINARSADFLFRKIKSPDKKIEYINTDQHKIISHFSGQEDIFAKIHCFIREKSSLI
jgi:carboxylesterase